MGEFDHGRLQLSEREVHKVYLVNCWADRAATAAERGTAFVFVEAVA